MSESPEVLTEPYIVRRQRLYEYTRDEYDLEVKAATYLMTGNAAGLAGCFAALREVAQNSAFQGVGFFIQCFLWGLFFAVIGYAILLRARSLHLITILASTPTSEIKMSVSWRFSYGCQFVSFIIFMGTLVMIADKLRTL
ncbi:MAG: hypothetical protein Q7T81_11685 [Pseudolabrys sp.]|nr:hypothetical protein [Pseudolabrys sp.]